MRVGGRWRLQQLAVRAVEPDLSCRGREVMSKRLAECGVWFAVLFVLVLASVIQHRTAAWFMRASTRSLVIPEAQAQTAAESAADVAVDAVALPSGMAYEAS